MKWICTAFSLVITVGLVGCGPSSVNVKGKVTYGAKTVKYGEVIVFGGDGVAKTAKIGKDGTYEIKDVTSGDMKFGVRSISPANAPPTEHGKKVEVSPEDLKNWFPLPAVYADPATSGLSANLKAKDNEYDIKLTEKGK